MAESPVSERQNRASSITRQAHVLWIDNAGGKGGRLRGDSGAFRAMPFSLAYQRNSRSPQTTPGELLAAAQSASFVLTLADLLARHGTPARELSVDAICQLDDAGSGRRLRALRLRVVGHATELDAAAFKKSADAALGCCPISRALSADVAIGIETELAAET